MKVAPLFAEKDFRSLPRKALRVQWEDGKTSKLGILFVSTV